MQVVIRRAYGNAVRFARLRPTLAYAGIELMDLRPHGQNQKNSGDIMLVVDALETALRPDCVVDTFVIASGDSDFTPLLSKLRSHGKGTVMMSRSASMSNLLPAYCDHTITLEDVLSRVPMDPADVGVLLKGILMAQGRIDKSTSVARVKRVLKQIPQGVQRPMDSLIASDDVADFIDVCPVCFVCVLRVCA